MMADEVAYHPENVLWDQLLSGFGTEVGSGKGTTGFDGVNFFSTAHKYSAEHPAQSNLSTAVLSATSLRAALVKMWGLKKANNNPLRIRPNMLFVGLDNYDLA